MCQMRILLDRDGEQQTVLENAALLTVTDEGIQVSSLFEEPLLLKDARLKQIDFLNGAVTLVAGNQGGR